MNSHVNSTTCLDDVLLSENLPPLVLFAFTRPDLLKQVLKAIAQQSLLPPKIIAFIDGPRNVDDKPLIEECISLLEEFSTSSSVLVDIVARRHNLGCDRNIISGLTEVLSSHDSLVYLEDDIVPNRHFYDRMSRLLEVYRDRKKVCSISAYASLPTELKTEIHKDFTDKDFIVSNRVFCWGFGTWSDRWKELDLINQSDRYNPFNKFYKIPATSQTKMTMINQFWLEKNQQTDWVITFTLAALYRQKVHIIPRNSFTYNIGFGHSQSKTYKGKEEAWVNARYDADFCPNSLPSSLELPSDLSLTLGDLDLTHHLLKQKQLWLNPSAFIYLLKKAKSFNSAIILIKLFITRLPLMLRRLRSGLPI